MEEGEDRGFMMWQRRKGHVAGALEPTRDRGAHYMDVLYVHSLITTQMHYWCAHSAADTLMTHVRTSAAELEACQTVIEVSWVPVPLRVLWGAAGGEFACGSLSGAWHALRLGATKGSLLRTAM